MDIIRRREDAERREGRRQVGVAGFECFKPYAEISTKLCGIDATERRRSDIETPKGACKEGDGSGAIAALQVVQGCRDLYERLKKAFLGLVQGEPDAFPVFVSFEELVSPVAVEAIGKGSGGPVEVGGHNFRSRQQGRCRISGLGSVAHSGTTTVPSRANPWAWPGLAAFRPRACCRLPRQPERERGGGW